ncbi:MAG TPA: site-2 protease family protein [Opitutaceae bacterium]|jgi:Zn-dependent protease
MHPDLTEGLLWYIVFLYSTTCHEAAHAWAALRLGDDTASKGGQVSLNPWPHLRRSPFGMAVVPAVSWVACGYVIGWASAPFDGKWAAAYPRRAALMALAGPCANLGLLLAAALLLRAGLEWNFFYSPAPFTAASIASADGSAAHFLAHLLSIAFSLNLILFVFNLIPVPPLDGSSVPLLLLPPSWAAGFMRLTRQPILGIIGILVLMNYSGAWFMPLLRWSTSLLRLGLPNP